MRALLGILTFVGVALAAPAVNSLRIAYYQDGANIPAGFVQRARAAGYNFVVGEFSPGHDSAVFQRSFALVKREGLALIPKIQMGNCHSGGWIQAFPALTNFNQVTTVFQGNPRYGMGCPSFADETSLGPHGIDSCFATLLLRIRAGMRAAGIPSLQYYHIGHDEPVFALSADGAQWKFHLCAGFGTDVNGNGDIEATEASATDRAYIADFASRHPDAAPDLAFRALLTRELYARIRQVRAVFGIRTQVLMYGDAWDPQQNGGRLTLATFDGRTVLLTPGAGDGADFADLPGLSAVDKKTVRQCLVVMPWQYVPKYGDRDYDSYAAFSYLKKKGYRFAFVSAMDDPRLTDDYRRQIAEYLRTSRLFPGNALGYMAATWWIDNTSRWDTAGAPGAQNPAYGVLETVREIERLQ